jgi:hypothetical protein
MRIWGLLAAIALSACSGSQTFLAAAPANGGAIFAAIGPASLHSVPSKLSFYGTGQKTRFQVVDTSSAGAVSVTSNNKSIVTVSAKSVKSGGYLTAKSTGAGHTTITLADSAGHKAAIRVQVVP